VSPRRRPVAPPIVGLSRPAAAALDLVARLHALRGDDIRLRALPTEFLHRLTRDPPASDAARLGAAVAVRTLREAAERAAPPAWPAAVDPADAALRAEGVRLAAVAMVALTARTGIGLTPDDPDDRPLLAVWPGDRDLAACFADSERESLDRKRRVVPYAVDEFLRDLREVPARLRRGGRILPEDPEPSLAGPYRFRPNHEDRVVRLYDFFRDKYGSPRGERRADLYLAVLGFLGAHREGLESAGDIGRGPGGKGITFRRELLEDLLAHPPGWFEGK
jgi:hypothetical protein